MIKDGISNACATGLSTYQTALQRFLQARGTSDDSRWGHDRTRGWGGDEGRALLVQDIRFHYCMSSTRRRAKNCGSGFATREMMCG